jgi:hypothetical protein
VLTANTGRQKILRMDTGKLTHRAEFELLHDEITLYQGEMHRTWLWAIIPAGSVYTWLSLNLLKLGAPLGRLVWFIPACFVFLCGIRYVLFWRRLSGLAGYLRDLEEDAFGDGKAGKLKGIARYNLKHSYPKMFFIGACVVWVVIFGCCSYLSWKLPEPHPVQSTPSAPAK